MKVIIFNNPECSKCQAAMEQLKKSSCEVAVVEYLKHPPGAEELRKIITMLGIEAEELVRKNESVFRQKYEGRSLSSEEWIEAMIEDPVIIQRPILVRGNSAIIGRDPVKLEEWLD